MPFWARARRALRQAIPCIGPSRSPSAIPTPNPADTHPNESQGQEPSKHHVSLQQQHPAVEYGSAHPVGGSQDISGGSPNVACQESPSPDPTSSVAQAQPSNLKSSGVPQAGASQDDCLNNLSEEGPSPDPASSRPQQQQPTSLHNIILPIGALLNDRTPQGAPSPGPTPSAAQQQQRSGLVGAPPIGEFRYDAFDGTAQESPSPDSNPSPPQQQSTASGRSSAHIEEPSIAKDKSISTWYTAFKGIVTLVGKVSEAFPPLKYAATGIQALMEVYDDFSSNKEEFEELRRKVECLNVILGQGETLPSGGKERWDGLGRAIESIGKQLERKTKQSNLVQVMTASEDKQEILRFIREIRFAIEITVLDIVVTSESLILRAEQGVARVEESVSTLAHGVAKSNKSDELEKLRAVEGYGLSPDAPQCAKGTRIALIAGLLAWATDPSSVHAFWLSGMAGTGKTAVSRTLCHRLIEHGVLSASFFCSIKEHDLSNVRNIFPSLAKTLATKHSEFAEALANIIEAGNPLVDEMTLTQQYDFLILRPAENAFRNFNATVVLCTDALDECNGSKAKQEFLHAVLSKKPGVRLKFFFTSRPEDVIVRAVETSSCSLHRNSLRLHDIEKDLVSSDIELYVYRELSAIPGLLEKYGECWPPPEVDQIVRRANGLFIVAATILRYISSESGDPVRRLKNLGAAGASTGVHQLYVEILGKAVQDLECSEKDDLRSCLSLLVAAQRPLYMTEYAALLRQEVSTVKASFRNLHSVVEMPGGKENNHPISIHHASFVDFLTSYSMIDPGASTGEARPLWAAIDRREAHAMVLESCLTLMDSKDRKKGLYLGVSGAQTSYQGNEDQQLPRLRSDLAYACTAWGNHALDAKPISDNLQRRIKIFLECKSLYWLEALSAERSIESSRILCHISQIVSLDGLAKLLVDIRDFAHMFATPMTFSAPHIYLSALPFQRAMSPGPQPWLPSIPSTAIVHIASRENGKTSGMSMKTGDFEHSGWVRSVAFSLNGAKIVSGSGDKTVRIWDAQSGDQIGKPMEGHSKWVSSVGFSPDGTRIVSGSGDKTVRIWDATRMSAEHWQIGSPMEGHSEAVTSVAFSPDGERIVSGSFDKTVRIWDAQCGKQMGTPMEGHWDGVCSVAFSSDGERIVSGSYDRTVRVWDTLSGEQMGSPMEGHSDTVSSVAFSPDGARIASGSYDQTVRIWDPQSGEQILSAMQGHSEWVRSVAFSLDGARIVSGSADKTLRVWDALSGEQMGPPIKGHSGPVWSVAFSPDGARIVSGSVDKTIRVWNALQNTPSDIFHLHDHSRFSLSIDRYGGIRNTSKDLLLWVPPQFRDHIQLPSMQLVIPPTTKVELSQALSHGVHWRECASSKPANPHPWPVTQASSISG